MRYSIRRNKQFSLLAALCTLGMLWTAPYISAAAEDSPSQPTTAREIFSNLNVPALETLKRTTRLDLLDYWDADSVLTARNVLGGAVWLDAVDPRYLKAHITPAATFEIKLLPVKGNDIVMTVYTTGGDGVAEDSIVEFFSPELNPLTRSKYMPGLTAASFLKSGKKGKGTLRRLHEAVPFATIKYSASAENDNLTAEITNWTVASEEGTVVASELLDPKRELVWKGKYTVEKR